MNGLTLYELTDAYRLAFSALPDDAEADQVHQALAALEGQIAVKGQNIAAYCLNLEAEAEAIEGAAKKLKARADSINRKVEGLKGYLFANMKMLNISEIKANDGTFKARIVKNPPAVEITGPIPAEYERVIPERREPDRKKLAEELKAGVIIEGAQLVQGERLKLE